MSEENKSSSTSSWGIPVLGTTGTIGAIVAFINVPSFVGWAGVGKALIVGLGTAVGGTIGTLGGLVAGGLALGIAGFIAAACSSNSTSPAKTALGLGAVGAIAGAVIGDVYGAVKGYQYTKDLVIEKFNTTAAVPAKKIDSSKTLVLTAADFARAEQKAVTPKAA